MQFICSFYIVKHTTPPPAPLRHHIYVYNKVSEWRLWKQSLKWSCFFITAIVLNYAGGKKLNKIRELLLLINVSLSHLRLCSLSSNLHGQNICFSVSLIQSKHLKQTNTYKNYPSQLLPGWYHRCSWIMVERILYIQKNMICVYDQGEELIPNEKRTKRKNHNLNKSMNGQSIERVR